MSVPEKGVKFEQFVGGKRLETDLALSVLGLVIDNVSGLLKHVRQPIHLVQVQVFGRLNLTRHEVFVMTLRERIELDFDHLRMSVCNMGEHIAFTADFLPADITQTCRGFRIVLDFPAMFVFRVSQSMELHFVHE